MKCLLCLAIVIMQISAKSDIDVTSLQCDNLQNVLQVKSQLSYINELYNLDLNHELLVALQLKESILDQKEWLLKDNPMVQSFTVKSVVNEQLPLSFIQKGLIINEISTLLHMIPRSPDKVEVCDQAILETNNLITKITNLQAEIQGLDQAEVNAKLNEVTTLEQECYAMQRPAYHNQQLLTAFGMTSESKNEIGYGYWARVLDYYPEEFHSDSYFLSRVSQNKNYDDQNLGDRKLVVSLQKNNLIFATYDMKSYAVNKDTSISLNPNKWFYVYYSYKDGHAVGFVKSTQRISKVEFHVEHFKLSKAWFKFGGPDVNQPGLNGQFAQLSYGVGEGTYINNAKQFVQMYRSTVPQKIEMRTLNVVDHLTQFPDKLSESIQMDLITEYAVSGWVKMHSNELVQVFYLQDSSSKYALSLFGGAELSVASYAKGLPLKKFSFEDENKEWHYVYMCYSYQEQTFNSFIYIDNQIVKAQEKGVRHNGSTQLQFAFGDQFDGQANHVKVMVGDGSFIQNPSQLPQDFKTGVEFLMKDHKKTTMPSDSHLTIFAVQQNHFNSLRIE